MGFFLGVSGLALLDEEAVLSEPTRIEEERDLMSASELADSANIFERDRLAAPRSCW
jgi:hypothetical protein